MSARDTRAAQDALIRRMAVAARGALDLLDELTGSDVVDLEVVDEMVPEMGAQIRKVMSDLRATVPLFATHDPECPQSTDEPRDPARCICEAAS
jgi:hypothetical protein